jgi:hypothetical protein
VLLNTGTIKSSGELKQCSEKNSLRVKIAMKASKVFKAINGITVAIAIGLMLGGEFSISDTRHSYLG